MTSEEYRKLHGIKKSNCQEKMTLSEYKKAKGISDKNDNNKKNKYGAKPKTVDGIRFHSTWEADRYSQLKMLEKAKEITNLQLQVRYDLVVNDIKICSYIADFVYNDKDGHQVVEDAKGFKTPEYKLKRSLMLAVFNIEIYESKKGNTSARSTRSKTRSASGP